jgi:Leucine Rich repeat
MPDRPSEPSWRSYLWLNAGALAVATIIYGTWFARISRSARAQREAVAAIRKASGTVRYDWDPKAANGQVLAVPPRKPGRIEKLLGADYVRDVVDVSLEGDADAVMHQIGRLSHLRTLDLTMSKVSDAGLAHLKGLTWLERLDLAQTPVSDAGLSHLTALVHLRRIDLSGTRVTDRGLVHLRGLSRPQLIIARDTAITADGVKDLQKYAPNVSVYGSYQQ